MKTTRTLRRASQWVVFLLFVFLFLNTEYKDNDVLPYAVNFFLRLDPLMSGAATLAGRTPIALVWPALKLVPHQLFDGLYRMPGPIPRISEPVCAVLKSHLPAFEQP